MDRVVIVGASAAGLAVAQTLREMGFGRSITVVGDETRAFCDRPPLSKGGIAGEGDLARHSLVTAADLDAMGIALWLGVAAVGVDLRDRIVRLADGGDLPFDGLVIATGVTPRRLPGSGLVVRGFDDALAALHDLNDRTGELIFIAVRIGLSVHYPHVVPATNALRMHRRAGAIRPAVGSATGHLLLSALDDARIARTVEAARAGSPNEPVPDLATVMADVARIRTDGHVLSTHTLTPGGGVLAMLLPDPPEGEPLAICLGGVGTVIVENGARHLAAMQDVVRRHIVNRVPA